MVPLFGTSFSRRVAFQYDSNALDTLICRYSAREREREGVYIFLPFKRGAEYKFLFPGAAFFFIRRRYKYARRVSGGRERSSGRAPAAGNSSWKSCARARIGGRWNDHSAERQMERCEFRRCPPNKSTRRETTRHPPIPGPDYKYKRAHVAEKYERSSK